MTTPIASRSLTTLTLAVCLSFVAGIAQADVQTCSSVFFDQNGNYAIGQYEIGAATHVFMTPDQLKDCKKQTGILGADDPNGNYECQLFYDSTGAFVMVADWRQNMIEQVMANSEEPYTGHLPANIRFNETLVEVLAKFRELPNNFPAWKIAWYAGGAQLSTGPCLRSTYGTAWEYTIVFDKDLRFVKIRASANSN